MDWSTKFSVRFHSVFLIIALLLLYGCAHQIRLQNAKSYSYEVNRYGIKNGDIVVSNNEKECWIEIIGYITDDTTRAFWIAVQDAESRGCPEKWVILDSNGGQLRPARIIANTIRSRDYNTTLRKQGGICNSVCPFVFISGNRREIPGGWTNAKIGLNQPKKKGPDGKWICSGRYEVSKEFVESMLPSKAAYIFYDAIAKTDCWKMYYMYPSELISSGIATGIRGDKTYSQGVATNKEGAVKAPNQTGIDGRFISYNNGTVLDTKTNLMWANRDNGGSITWENGKIYCENYRGGGYSDWRMPTIDELSGLYDREKVQRSAIDIAPDIHIATEFISITGLWCWASETRNQKVAIFDFIRGEWGYSHPSLSVLSRILPVRSVK